MNLLLVFFAIPVAIIILSIILETLLHNPYKVAGIFFSIFLVIAFALGASAALIAIVIGYTILSLITAFLVKLFCSRRRFYPHCPEYYNFNNTLYEAEDLKEDNGSYFNYQYNQEPNCRCNNRFRK